MNTELIINILVFGILLYFILNTSCGPKSQYVSYATATKTLESVDDDDTDDDDDDDDTDDDETDDDDDTDDESEPNSSSEWKWAQTSQDAMLSLEPIDTKLDAKIVKESNSYELCKSTCTKNDKCVGFHFVNEFNSCTQHMSEKPKTISKMFKDGPNKEEPKMGYYGRNQYVNTSQKAMYKKYN